ncbi:response regulator receiver protein [Chloroherpeton thalassium ATCC 35110]|uniref:Response regulator receiver protein n=1 Tax=Chloroherpeton thalassium (strain ATCC 35110 / GB-78) TaxID=517418 RepID=B3QZB8_CHLT3|nr:bifunctional response regulator/alkaline phosphatase family protein [Chloroherpeton thalassium]ACF13811.1 response regulator receiver protein [Chloroherpeton thalassium ATCC 35110]
MKYKILWADDEIDFLRPHVMFLSDKGYDVTCVMNGADALERARQNNYDLIFLDEKMPGISGLDTLSEIKNISPATPVVMITKSEEESLMNKAIGKKISEYLIKPVNPNQIWLACKKLLESNRLKEGAAAQDYISEFNRITQELMGPMDDEDWRDLHRRLSEWEVELDEHPNLDLRETLVGQKRECNLAFSRFIENNYADWCATEKDTRPMLSVDVLEKKVIPELDNDGSVFFFVIDCLRYDQWLILERTLQNYFNIEHDSYFSILPSATPYARNAIFSGLFPADIAKRLPSKWIIAPEAEQSRNSFEQDFLEDFLKRRRVSVKSAKYTKLIGADDSRTYEQTILGQVKNKLNAVVVNFVDILAHSRFDSQVIRELSPDEAAYRSLTQTWFEYSSLHRTLKALANEKVTIILTTDHGSIRSMRHTKVIGDREASTNLRYKFGRNLQCDQKHAIYIKDPATYRLPRQKLNENCIIAKEDYYFVYPTNYHKFINQYKDSFQHGGVSLEEIVVPCMRLTPR